MNDEEAYDLRNIVIPEWRDAVDSLWPFDKENIASYGNDFRHLHWHLIPRRRPDNVPEMDGVEFRDENWGSHYKNHLEGEKPPRETVIQIRDDLKHALD